ncbi:hypothetical protein M438DRAFT_33865 [Aureobasidium pullulans EXF-150]|uniref:Uncharacterized protein n=1 Tax=Aureobasidium pullulans EXF-150 TaxID=1043002 RepID=A0A074XIF6_AURPU|nr:uncharacterized protein M438DRAFT_33865 [Aureobasidium pullulans EXF-150]KEQ83469.1 hypothetical protein M438DRAFT_33865 [Aureobasidium pullulans EXF-150]
MTHSPGAKAYIYHCPSLVVVSSSNNSNSFLQQHLSSLWLSRPLFTTLFTNTNPTTNHLIHHHQNHPVASTTYVCPAQTTLPVAPIACTSCPYTVSTATVYSATGGNMVPVSTQVYAAPCPTGTVVVEKVCTACAAMTSTVPAGNTQTVTACNGANCPATSTMAKYTPTTSGMVMYTGAASNVKAAPESALNSS